MNTKVYVPVITAFDSEGRICCLNDDTHEDKRSLHRKQQAT